jgi:hypothetical protein
MTAMAPSSRVGGRCAGGGVRGLRRGVPRIQKFDRCSVAARASPAGRPFKKFKPCTLPSRLRLACAPCYFTSLSITLTSHLHRSNHYFLVRIVFHDVARLPRDLNMYVPPPPPHRPRTDIVFIFSYVFRCNFPCFFGGVFYTHCVRVISALGVCECDMYHAHAFSPFSPLSALSFWHNKHSLLYLSSITHCSFFF